MRSRPCYPFCLSCLQRHTHTHTLTWYSSQSKQNPQMRSCRASLSGECVCSERNGRQSVVQQQRERASARIRIRILLISRMPRNRQSIFIKHSSSKRTQCGGGEFEFWLNFLWGRHAQIRRRNYKTDWGCVPKFKITINTNKFPTNKSNKIILFVSLFAKE